MTSTWNVSSCHSYQQELLPCCVSCHRYQQKLLPCYVSHHSYQQELLPCCVSCHRYQQKLLPCYVSHHRYQQKLLPCYVSCHRYQQKLLPCYVSHHRYQQKLLPCYMSRHAHRYQQKTAAMLPVPSQVPAKNCCHAMCPITGTSKSCCHAMCPVTGTSKSCCHAMCPITGTSKSCCHATCPVMLTGTSKKLLPCYLSRHRYQQKTAAMLRVPSQVPAKAVAVLCIFLAHVRCWHFIFFYAHDTSMTRRKAYKWRKQHIIFKFIHSIKKNKQALKQCKQGNTVREQNLFFSADYLWG